MVCAQLLTGKTSLEGGPASHPQLVVNPQGLFLPHFSASASLELKRKVQPSGGVSNESAKKGPSSKLDTFHPVSAPDTLYY